MPLQIHWLLIACTLDAVYAKFRGSHTRTRYTIWVCMMINPKLMQHAVIRQCTSITSIKYGCWCGRPTPGAVHGQDTTAPVERSTTMPLTHGIQLTLVPAASCEGEDPDWWSARTRRLSWSRMGRMLGQFGWMIVEICVIFNLCYIFVVVPFTTDGDTLSFREGWVVGPTAPTSGRLRLPACVLGRF